MVENEKIGVLTYTTKHRKTYDLLCLLKARGYSDVTVYASAFTYQKKYQPTVLHRPEPFDGMPDTQEICRNLQYKYVAGNRDRFQIEPDRLLLIAGASILPLEFVKNHTIINAHPGYIPNCRGLDAFKWAVLEKQPIGVTTHFLGEDIDAGFVIERKIMEVCRLDTFHTVARRVYETEVTMLVDAVKLCKTQTPFFVPPGDSIVHKRMPNEVEAMLMNSFEEYKASVIKKGKNESISLYQ